MSTSEQGAAQPAASQDQHVRLSETRTATIARLNDAFRANFAEGRVVLTIGIQSLGEETVLEVLKRVQSFVSFDDDIDPYHEHDFGSIEYRTQVIFWKIDYYDRGLSTSSSDDPADPELTCRVLTIMLAAEY